MFLFIVKSFSYFPRFKKTYLKTSIASISRVFTEYLEVLCPKNQVLQRNGDDQDEEKKIF